MAELRYLLTILFFYALLFTITSLIQVVNPSFEIMQGFDMAFYGGEIVAIMISCGVPFVGGGVCAGALTLSSLISFFVVSNYYVNILFIIINVALSYVMMQLATGGG